jgi:non-specific serine/threonine protein kinase/serine/threonine-protein kinase
VETQQEWGKIKELFGAALERDPSERSAFLHAACGTNISLREEVESLIRAHDSSSDLLQRPLLPQPSENSAGRFIGPYQLLNKIGEGGMGQVWLAQQSAPLQRRVALKLIRWGMYDDTLLHRFKAERQSLAVMDHPSIAKVFDAGSTPEGQPYFVMEYVDGVPITEYCDQKKLNIHDRLELFIKVCEGVQHAHQKAVIHRDLKPANILVVEVDGKPVPRIIDFGLAKAMNREISDESLHTRIGNFVGTPGYMSPEQCDPTAQDVDTRTDVFSLGVVLYVLLAGNLPFDVEDWKNQPLDEMLRRMREEDPPQPSTKVGINRDTSSTTAESRGTEPKQLITVLRGDLDWITMKAIEKDRTRRYGTPSELAADISRYLRNEPVIARPVSFSYRAQKYVRRHRYPVAAAAVLVLLLLVFSIMQSVELRNIRRARDQADRITDFMTQMFKVSDPGEARGNSITAREILDKASRQIETGLSKDPETQAHMMYVIAEVYDNLGLIPEAESLIRNAFGIQKRILGPENPESLRSASLLAKLLLHDGHDVEAEKLQRETLDIQRRKLGPEHPDTLTSMRRLAAIWGWQGRISDAVKLQRSLLDIDRRRLGPEDPETLVMTTGLASIILNGGNDYGDAEKLLRDNLPIEMRVFGQEHPDTVNTMINLAMVLRQEGRFAESEAMSRATLDPAIRVYGAEHVDTLDLRNNLAIDLAKEGRYRDAEEVYYQIREIQRRVLGPDNPYTAVTTYNLGCLAAVQGQSAKALSILREAIDHGLRSAIATDMENDDDLKSLKGDPRFADLVAYAKQRAGQKAN